MENYKISLRLFILSLFFLTIHCQKGLNTENIIDNHNYAPIQIDNEWVYIQKYRYFPRPLSIKVDSINSYLGGQIKLDTIVIRSSEKVTTEGKSLIILKVNYHTIDTKMYTTYPGRDTTIVSKGVYIFSDTLSIEGDSIKLHNKANLDAPYFNLIDYPDSSKRIVHFKHRKLFLARNSKDIGTAFYLDTYGMVKWEWKYWGNGWGYSTNTRLIKFNNEAIDSNFVESITQR